MSRAVAVSKGNKITALHGWRRALFSLRTRLLLWYCLLTACATLISIQTTNSIYSGRMEMQAEASALQQADQFNRLIDNHRRKGTGGPPTLTILFDRLLSAYVPTRNEYIVMLANSRVYKVSPRLPANLISPYPDLIGEWALLGQRQMRHLSFGQQRLLYVAQPMSWNGDRGTIVVLQDVTSDFRLGKDALILVMQVMLVFLAIFSVLAWFTVGRVLFPLRLLTKTAQSITESDMHQRIPVQGKDEIAELTATFNEMLERLQLAFDSQKEFLKDASHELRTPITVIQGHLEMLHYRPEKQAATIALLMDELDRMSRLVNDLLLLAKAEHPDFLTLRPEELDWLTEELFLKARSLADRDWQLDAKGVSPITVDRQRLTQAVMNLAQNAVRHTPDGATICLGSAVKGNYAYLWVRDTGEGIAPENWERIFQRFVRATQQDQQVEQHGLGLAIVQAIATAHGGWVELDSQLGQGATFTLVIPLVPALDVAADESHSHRRR
ncbi:MAG: HAMP domain-containing histidine kinase [Aphanocapsa sp. GSE-SYN-MK-11-07L]|nr:HAMP domain-containing histidine kinase [Aphanocapsa sp. GSE-SYN-MK-11-07L]